MLACNRGRAEKVTQIFRHSAPANARKWPQKRSIESGATEKSWQAGAFADAESVYNEVWLYVMPLGAEGRQRWTSWSDQ